MVYATYTHNTKIIMRVVDMCELYFTTLCVYTISDTKSWNVILIE